MAAKAVVVVAMAVGKRPEVKEEGNVIGVSHILLIYYLAQSRGVFLANAYVERSQCLASRQTLSVPQIDVSAHADRKMIIFMSICINSQRNHNFTE